jgi:predicted amidohydrolase
MKRKDCFMARMVKISTIGAKAPTAPADASLDTCISLMLDHLHSQIEYVLPDQPDLILLPEMCDRFSNFSFDQNKYYFDHRGTIIQESVARIAAEHHCYIAYPTLFTSQDGSYRNTLIMYDRKGMISGYYHKVYPTIDEMYKNNILAGNQPVVMDCDFGRVGSIICFDLNFQELIDQYKRLKPDIMLFSSMYHGGLVQQTWAYGTRSYFVSSVQGLESAIRSPLGQKLAYTTNYHHFVTATLNLDFCVTFLGLNQEKLKRAKQKYKDQIKISDPGYLGAVMLLSESYSLSAEDVAKEFDIELIDPYFDRVRQLRIKKIGYPERKV